MTTRNRPPARSSSGAAAPRLELNLYDEITEWSVRDLVERLQASPTADVTLRINSPGGDVHQGFNLANALRQHAGRKVAIVQGVCASAATFPACACDEIQMHAESSFMVHSPWGGATGNADDLESYAKELRRLTDLMVGLYQRKTGQPEDTIRGWLSTDTWMKPSEAKAAGFCDVILDEPLSASIRRRAARFVARLRNPVRSTMPIPENLRNKLAKHGLTADGANLEEAFRSYLATTEDGPKDRQEMARAIEEMKDEPEDTGTGEHTDEGDGTTGEKKSRVRRNAHSDPAVQKLIDNLTQRANALEAKEQQRAEDEYFASAEEHTSREEAAEYLKLCNNDHAKALALVRKLPPKKGRGLGPWYKDGKPVGGPSNASADGYEATKIVRAGRATYLLHGHGLAQLAKKIAKERSLPLAAAYKAAARERPDLASPTE